MVAKTKKNHHKSLSTILVLLGVIFGVLFGFFFPEFMISIRWIGEVFFNLLKMLVLPLIFSALVSSIASMGGLKKLGSLGVFTMGYILVSVCTAVIIGMTLFNVFNPGLGINPSLIANAADLTTIHNNTPVTLGSYITSLFPSNILEAAVKFDVMPIVIFALMFSIACSSLGDSAKGVVNLLSEIKVIFIKMITWVINLSPIGIFSLLGTGVAESVKQNHFAQDIIGLSMFVLVFLCGLLLQFGWQLLAVKLITKRAAKHFLKGTSYSLATAFGTASTLATLPVSMDAVQKEKVREDVNRFVMPFTSTINLGSTVMYEASAALFFSQILGRHLSFGDQMIIFVTSIVAGMGCTGIPEGGLITMVTVLRSVNIPTSALAVLLPIDRILDRFRTMVNVFGNICCACIVDELVKKHEQKKALIEQQLQATIEEERQIA
ncbi:MAG: dicarboxylate/amino acid:cation symporter [Bdellovibrionota bacterium]